MPVSTKNMDEDHIRDIKAPTASGEGGVGLVEAAFTEDYEYDETDGPMLSTEQISKEMVTLSLVPKSKWQTLLHLDSIKVIILPFASLILAFPFLTIHLGTQ